MVSTEDYKVIATYYGEQMQPLLAIEEMSELTKELIKEQRGENNRGRILEEIAHVKIMMVQLQLIYDPQNDYIERLINNKIYKALDDVHERKHPNEHRTT